MAGKGLDTRIGIINFCSKNKRFNGPEVGNGARMCQLVNFLFKSEKLFFYPLWWFVSVKVGVYYDNKMLLVVFREFLNHHHDHIQTLGNFSIGIANGHL